MVVYLLWFQQFIATQQELRGVIVVLQVAAWNPPMTCDIPLERGRPARPNCPLKATERLSSKNISAYVTHFEVWSPAYSNNFLQITKVLQLTLLNTSNSFIRGSIAVFRNILINISISEMGTETSYISAKLYLIQISNSLKLLSQSFTPLLLALTHKILCKNTLIHTHTLSLNYKITHILFVKIN